MVQSLQLEKHFCLRFAGLIVNWCRWAYRMAGSRTASGFRRANTCAENLRIPLRDGHYRRTWSLDIQLKLRGRFWCLTAVKYHKVLDWMEQQLQWLDLQRLNPTTAYQRNSIRISRRIPVRIKMTTKYFYIKGVIFGGICKDILSISK